MSLDCQLEKIKANKSNDKSMLRHFENYGNFLGHPVLKLLNLSQLAHKGLGEDFF
jgi:hypothetical protein